MKKLTFSMENYLEAIYELSENGKGVRVSDIAERLGVAKSSTNSAMAALSKRELIIAEKYKEVYLTTKGFEIAEFTAKKHKTIQQFFTDVLNINAKIADEDACAIEHVISKESVLAMKKFLSEFNDDSKENRTI